MYWGDYLADTSSLKMLEHGAYMLLIAHYWQTGEPIPHDRRYQVAKATNQHERKAVDYVVAHYFQLKGGAAFHERVGKELAKEAEKSAKRGKAAKTRWAKNNANAYSDASEYSQSQLNITSNEVITPLPPKGAESVLKELFKKFWNEYPRKASKTKAFEAFKRLKPTTELLTTMLEALNVQKQSDQWAKEAGKFIPLPTTWLNQKRWLDEPSAYPKATTSSQQAGYRQVNQHHEGVPEGVNYDWA